MRTTILQYDLSKIVDLAREGKRLDGRALDEIRDFTIELGMCENAEGSARVRLGSTEVVAGIKMGVDKPYPDSPDEGAISVGAELLPLAHSEYEAGPPSFSEIEVARVVDRGIRESKAIDFTKLCIKEGEAVWIAFMDFYAINADGNLFDAGSIAGLVTFMSAKMPKLNDKNKIIKHEYSGELKLTRHPLLATFVKLGDKIMADPTYLEEKASTARFSVATTEDGYMSAMQKGPGYFNAEEVKYMIEKGFEINDAKRKKIFKLIKK
ncbi:MAG: exosome complex protein Rrp42 [archaeon]